MLRKIAVAVWLYALAQSLAVAEVADSAANGFTIKIAMNIRASPADVYARLVHSVGQWWSSEHTFSGDARNLSIDERAMGCFCEKLPGGGSVRHMEVVFFAPGKMLRMSGGLGPLQGIGATGSMSIGLSAADGGTKLEVTYAVVGYQPQGMNAWATPVDGVLTEQFTRLKSYIETGKPAGNSGTTPH
jgi:hypothetical protein